MTTAQILCKEDPSLYCKEGFLTDFRDNMFDISGICSLSIYLRRYCNVANIRTFSRSFGENDSITNCVCAFELFIQEEFLNKGKEPAEVFEEYSFLSSVVCYRKYKFIPYLALYGVDMNKPVRTLVIFVKNELAYLVYNLFYKLSTRYYGSTKNFIETYKTLCMCGCDDSAVLGILIRCTKAPYGHMKVHKFSLSKEINSKPISDFFMSMYREELEKEGISD